MVETKRGKSTYSKKFTIRKRLSGSRGTTTFKGKRLPVPIVLFKDVDEE